MNKVNKLKIMVSVVVALMLIAVICYMSHSKKSDEHIYAIKDVFEVEVLGTEGYGYINVMINKDFMDKKDFDISKLSYEIDKNNMLSNGDIITISIDDTTELKFDNMKFEYKVFGLEKGTDLDIFKDLIIEYDSSTGKIILDNSKCSQFIKENVLFSIKYQLDRYEVGDVVEIVVYVDMNAATDNRYNIISKTYEYTVK